MTKFLLYKERASQQICIGRFADFTVLKAVVDRWRTFEHSAFILCRSLRLLPFADYTLHCTQINSFELGAQMNIFVNVLVLVNVLMAIIFCFRDDRARSTWKVRNVNHVFRAKNLSSDSHSREWNKSTSRDLRRSHSPSRLRRSKITLSLRSREINKSSVKKRWTCGKSGLSNALYRTMNRKSVLRGFFKEYSKNILTM